MGTAAHQGQEMGNEHIYQPRNWGSKAEDRVWGGRASLVIDLDEEERSIGGGVAVDVDAHQDEGCYEEHCQHDAHNGAQVHGGALSLRSQVILETYKETFMLGWDREIKPMGSGSLQRRE